VSRRSCYLASRLFGVATLVAIAGILLARPTKAQSDPSSLPYSTILTPDRALAFVQAADAKLDYVPGEVLVKFKDGVSTVGQQRALMALRSRPDVSDLRWIGDVALFTDQRERNATILAAQLSTQPEVAYAEPNYLHRLTATPNDPEFSSRQWNLTALDMPRVWDINPGASDRVVVAVVDSGITTVNQAFGFPTWNGQAIESTSVRFRINPDLSVGRLVSPYDFVFGGPVLDMVGHGTHVSSTIGEDTNNALAEAGIAYNVKIMPVKVCLGFWEIQFVLAASGFRDFAPLDAGVCPDDAIAQGIRYAADNGAHVINLSVGGPTSPPLVLRDALLYAVQRGVFVALSAGNNYQTGTPPNPVIYPAAFAATIEGVMSVGAVGPSLSHSYYSSAGSYVEIAAPGGNIREGGPAGAIWQTTILESDFDAETVLFPRFDRYVDAASQGTSMAAPHVAGIAALLRSQGITTPSALEAIIKATALDLGAPGRDDLYGYGLIQPRAALRGVGVK
jgi:serine protease